MRHTLALGELNHPTDETAPPVPDISGLVKPAVSQVEQIARQVEEVPQPVQELVTFVKNLHPKEKIRLADGATFVFPNQAFTTSDPELIAKLREVAKNSHIAER